MDAGVAAATAPSALALGLDMAMLIGVAMAVALFVPREAKLKVTKLVVDGNEVVRQLVEKFQSPTHIARVALIERAAQLERRKLTDFCMTALTDAARRTIAEHETLLLSDNDRAVFFDALVSPPAPSERLQRAVAEHKRRVVP